MLVHEFLRRSVDRWPDQTGVVEVRGSRSYADLYQDAARIAQVLVNCGVKRGDRVVLALENSHLWVTAFFGILEAGGVVVPLAAGQKNDRLQYAVRDCTPVACIVDEATASALGPAGATLAMLVDRRGGDHVRHVALDLHRAMAQASPVAPLVRVIDVDLAAIVYTSGSTGAPRGVMLSHLNLTANAESIVQYLRLTPRDRMMVVLPFHYVYGLSLLTTHLSVGGSLAIDNRFAIPNIVLKSMQQFEVTGLAGVPSTFALFLHRSSIARMAFPSLRYVTQAGGAMPPALLQQWLRVLPNVPFYVMYGATEASARLAYLDPSQLSARVGSIGTAIPNVELAVIRENGQRASPGEVGEIVARGSNIMMGYWNCPEDTAAALGPHGFRTGDLAQCDSEGFLYIVGRRQDMLKVGGERVGAKEIEDVLHEHPAVHEAAVVGAAHELFGEVPVAFVALCPDASASPEQIVSFCRSRLPDHKVPVRIMVQDDLPKSAAGKIDKPALRALVKAVAAS
jgi:long-chain acyl-CoA synthetase